MGKANTQLLAKVRSEIINGDALRLFQEEYFALDIIRLLYEDTVDEKEKIQLLTVLQEYGGAGLETSSVDQIITSLVDICTQSLSLSPKSSFLSQVIITTTSLLIQFNLVGASSHLCLLLTDLLLPLVKKTDDTSNLRLRGVACCCLSEMEDFCPGLLKKHLTSILKTAQLETTYIYQDIVCLLSRIIHNTMTWQNLLDVVDTRRSRKISEELPSPDEKSLLELEIKQFVSLVMDNYILFTSSGIWSLLQTMILLVKSDLDISASIFKSLTLQFMASSNASTFLMVVYMKMQFSHQILSVTEETLLHKRFVMAAIHPANNVAQKHILLSCLADYIGYNETKQSKQFPSVNPVPIVAIKQLADLKPTAFDDIPIQLKKTLILNKCLPVSKDADNSVLLNNLESIKKMALCTDDAEPTLALFCALFHFYCRHHISDLGTKIQNLLLQLVTSNPKFIPSTLDFLVRIDKEVPDSSIYLYLLQQLHDMVTGHVKFNMPEQQLHSYLDILKLTAADSRIQPQATVRFLHMNILYSLMYGNISWFLATATLSVCRNILLHHKTHSIFNGMDCLLHVLMTHCSEVDVVDRAIFYYSLLNGAADSKIQEILSSADLKMTRRQISNIIHSPSTPANPASMLSLEKPFMKWERISIHPIWKTVKFHHEDPHEEFEEINPGKGAFLHYLDLIAAEDSTFLLAEYRLSVTSECPMDELRAITLNIETDGNLEKIPEIHIPNMTKTESKTIQLQFYSLQPFPGDYPTKSVFASVDRITMSCNLETTSISFTDLMLPIPWENLGVAPEKRKDVFTELWEYLDAKNSNKNATIESVKTLPLDLPGLCQLIDSVLLPYTVYKSEKNFHCAIFLPPRHHLLLKLNSILNHTAVSILTDFWPILPSVNCYLDSLIAIH